MSKTFCPGWEIFFINIIVFWKIIKGYEIILVFDYYFCSFLCFSFLGREFPFKMNWGQVGIIRCECPRELATCQVLEKSCKNNIPASHCLLSLKGCPWRRKKKGKWPYITLSAWTLIQENTWLLVKIRN